MKTFKKVAVLIPAYNEEAVIGRTLRAILRILPAEDVYVVDDGSDDNTSGVAKQYTDNVLVLQQNQGKANAENTGIQYFNLPDRYTYLLPMDADSLLTPQFLTTTVSILDKDVEKKY